MMIWYNIVLDTMIYKWKIINMQKYIYFYVIRSNEKANIAVIILKYNHFLSKEIYTFTLE